MTLVCDKLEQKRREVDCKSGRDVKPGGGGGDSGGGDGGPTS